MDTSAACFAKRGEYVTRTIAGEAIVVPIRGQVGDLDAVYNMNAEAAFIWELIDGRTSVAQIVDAIVARFDVAREEAERDAMEFIAGLQEAGMIEPCAPPGCPEA